MRTKYSTHDAKLSKTTCEYEHTICTASYVWLFTNHSLYCQFQIWHIVVFSRIASCSVYSKHSSINGQFARTCPWEQLPWLQRRMVCPTDVVTTIQWYGHLLCSFWLRYDQFLSQIPITYRVRTSVGSPKRTNLAWPNINDIRLVRNCHDDRKKRGWRKQLSGRMH